MSNVEQDFRPRCAVCSGPVGRIEVTRIEFAHTIAGVPVCDGKKVVVLCHGQTWRLTLNEKEPLPSVFFAKLDADGERKFVASATDLEVSYPAHAAALIFATDYNGNRLQIRHLSTEEAERQFIERSAL